MREIVSYTALRGIAAVGVMMFHYSLFMPDGFIPARALKVINNSYALVDFIDDDRCSS